MSGSRLNRLLLLFLLLFSALLLLLQLVFVVIIVYVDGLFLCAHHSVVLFRYIGTTLSGCMVGWVDVRLVLIDQSETSNPIIF